jgi:hypothetical protein
MIKDWINIKIPSINFIYFNEWHRFHQVAQVLANLKARTNDEKLMISLTVKFQHPVEHCTFLHPAVKECEAKVGNNFNLYCRSQALSHLLEEHSSY